MNSTVIQFHSQTDTPDIRFVRGLHVRHTFPRHTHRSFSFGIVQQGRRVIEVDGEPYTISADECFIINPHQPHACRVAGEGEHAYGIVSIPPALFQALFKEVADKDSVPHFPQVKITDASILRGFTAWLENQSPAPPSAANQLTDVLRDLVLRYAEAETPPAPDHPQHTLVALACDYIETHVNHPVRLDELADVAHVTPFYLNRLFREAMGLPPYAYLLQARIKRSLEVLLQTDSILETTYALGFADQSHFSRFFKKNVGLTPKRYLDLHKNSAP
ncbi:MAG: AraC family transcriptional regulator [Anaerolineae bacterium]|nr:AraC family transcriptional regulator [Anaerolineae bacterium]